MPTTRAPPAAGLLYTSAPRGELTGTAEFVDARHGLEAVVRFGPLDDARPGSLLARPDAFSGTITRCLPSGELARDPSAGWQMPAAADKVREGPGACGAPAWADA